MIYILVDRIRSLYNVGAVFRIADAIKAKKIFLNLWSGGVKLGGKMKLHPKIAKTALRGIGTPYEFITDATSKLRQLKKKNVQIVALEQTPRSVDYRAGNYRLPLCVIVGHELDGVSPDLLAQADLAVDLPMRGKGKSLNVACALAVALYTISDKLSLN